MKLLVLLTLAALTLQSQAQEGKLLTNSMGGATLYEYS